MSSLHRRAPVSVPVRFEVREDGAGLHVTWRWFRWPFVFLVLWCAAWDFMVYQVLRGGLQSGRFPWPALPHVAAGVVGTAWCLMGFVNRTRVFASAEGLHISHGPLWWRPGRTFAPGELAQLCATESIRPRGRAFQLCAVDHHGKQHTLLRFLRTRDEALYLEQALGQRLGLEEAPVDRELAPRG